MVESALRKQSAAKVCRDSSSLDIVVVEDHADTRKYLRMFLEMNGHRVRTAGAVGEALGLLRVEACQVLISDIGLPDGDGWELLRRIPDGRLDFAIAMSGFGTGSDRQRSQDAGFCEHLVKPFDLTRLAELLRRMAGDLD